MDLIESGDAAASQQLTAALTAHNLQFGFEQGHNHTLNGQNEFMLTLIVRGGVHHFREIITLLI